MSLKFFSLIYGNDIHLSPGTKILPAKEFSTLLDAKQVLATVKEDAKKYRLEVAKECEKIKEKAQKEGFEEGFKQWAKYVAALEKEIKDAQEEVHKVVVPLALKAARKIVGREIELNNETTVDIVTTSLKGVSQHKKITIYVSRKDLDVLEKHKDRIKSMFEHLEVLSIRERGDVQPGGCIIETEAGIINAQLEHKWQTIEQAFAMVGEKLNPHKT